MPYDTFRNSPGSNLIDPKYNYGLAMMREGINTSPIQAPAQGYARLANALLGGWLQKSSQDDQGAANEALQRGAQAGGYDGAVSELAKLGNNPYAGRLTQALVAGKLGESPESFGSPTEVTQNGQPGMVQMGNRGTIKPLPGYTPYNKPDAPKTITTNEGVFILKPDGTLGNRLGSPHDASGNAGQETFGNTPIWGTDAQGNPVLMQPSNRGNLKTVQLPPGVTPQRGQTSKVDLGDRFGILDANGSLIGYMPKNLAPGDQPDVRAAQAKAVEVAKAQGTAQVNLPGASAEADYTTKLVDDLINHPGMSTVVGVPEGAAGVLAKLGINVPGTEAANFNARLEQLGGRQFLEAFEKLKGGGQITEVEGQKATVAISRLMKINQSEESYRQAAEEFKTIVRGAVARAKLKAGNQPMQAPQGQAPQTAPQISPQQAPQPQEYDYVPGRGLIPRQ